MWFLRALDMTLQYFTVISWYSLETGLVWVTTQFSALVYRFGFWGWKSRRCRSLAEAWYVGCMRGLAVFRVKVEDGQCEYQRIALSHQAPQIISLHQKGRFLVLFQYQREQAFGALGWRQARWCKGWTVNSMLMLCWATAENWWIMIVLAPCQSEFWVDTTVPEICHFFLWRPLKICHLEQVVFSFWAVRSGGKHDQRCPPVRIQAGLHQQRPLAFQMWAGRAVGDMMCTTTYGHMTYGLWRWCKSLLVCKRWFLTPSAQKYMKMKQGSQHTRLFQTMPCLGGLRPLKTTHLFEPIKLGEHSPQLEMRTITSRTSACASLQSLKPNTGYLVWNSHLKTQTLWYVKESVRHPKTTVEKSETNGFILFPTLFRPEINISCWLLVSIRWFWIVTFHFQLSIDQRTWLPSPLSPWCFGPSTMELFTSEFEAMFPWRLWELLHHGQTTEFSALCT